MKCFNLIQNTKASAVSEILRYRPTEILLLYYKHEFKIENEILKITHLLKKIKPIYIEHQVYHILYYRNIFISRKWKRTPSPTHTQTHIQFALLSLSKFLAVIMSILKRNDKVLSTICQPLPLLFYLMSQSQHGQLKMYVITKLYG